MKKIKRKIKKEIRRETRQRATEGGEDEGRKWVSELWKEKEVGGWERRTEKRLRSRRTRFVGICGVEVLDKF